MLTRSNGLILMMVVTRLFHACLGSVSEFKRKTRCYSNPPLGCFTISLSGVYPLPMEQMYIKCLFVRGHYRTTVDWRDVDKLLIPVIFDGSKIYIIFYGYQESIIRNPWVTKLIDSINKKEPDSVIVLVRWTPFIPMLYFASARTAQVVSALVGYWLKKLADQGFDMSKVHIIGNSLGAHMAGGVGKLVKGIGRITGLDPSNPLYHGFDWRLKPSDARVVDVIHSDAIPTTYLPPIGFLSTMGTADYYLNGAKAQPGCPQVWKDFVYAPLVLNRFWYAASICSHERSHEIYIASIINTCPFYARRCSSLKEVIAGTCRRCSEDQIRRLELRQQKQQRRSQTENDLGVVNFHDDDDDDDDDEDDEEDECVQYGHNHEDNPPGIYAFENSQVDYPFCEFRRGYRPTD